MNLIKTSILTTISTVIKIISSFIINKFIAIYIGPSGLAMIGQMRNFIGITSSFSNGAITQGIVKYIAEFREERENKQKYFKTGVAITLICSIVTGIGIFIFAEKLSYEILNNSDYSFIFRIFAFTIILFSLNTFFMSVLNGEGEIKKYVLLNIIGSIVSSVFTSSMVIIFHLEGALLAMVINQSIVFFVTLILVRKSKWFDESLFYGKVDKEALKDYFKYSMMSITAATVGPLSQIFVREYIGKKLGWDSAGFWQGIFFISNTYLMVVTTALGVYYLPKLSSIKDKIELKKEIINGYKIIMPIVILMALVIYFIKTFIVHLLFSEKFLPMVALFKWQLIGDVMKIGSWLLGYMFIAKAKVNIFITKEITISIVFVLFSILFINIYGLIGVTYAFTASYILNFSLLSYLFYFYYKKNLFIEINR